MKSSLRSTSNILVLISAILQSVSAAIVVIFFAFFLFVGDSFYYYATLDSSLSVYDIYGLQSVYRFFFLIALVFIAVYMPLLWIARHKASKGSKGWSVYGLVQSILVFDPIAIAGYICSLIDISSNNKLMNSEEPTINTEESTITNTENVELENKTTELKEEI